MARYSLWISSNSGKYLIPLSRNNEETKEKVDLYEIDLVTISLGKEKFVETVKSSKIVPADFDWSTAFGYIQHRMNKKDKYLPLLFKKDKTILQMINFVNEFRYHEKIPEEKLVQQFFTKNYISHLYEQLLTMLSDYCTKLIILARDNYESISNSIIPQKVKKKLYCFIQSTNYDEQLEYKNDILKELLFYINFRKVKTFEYGCSIREPLINSHSNAQKETEEREDIDEFLTEDELANAYLINEEEKVYGKKYE